MEVGAPSKLSDPTDRSMYKNRLQEFTQKAGIPLPLYQTTNEGYSHAPQFRSTVVVDGTTFISSSAYVHRKAAEQDVAKVALEGISAKIKDEGVPLMHEDSSFCKSILNEYAVKMNLGRPIYSTSQAERLLPIFISSSVFNGETFIGSPAKSKKEAERLAARVVIESILANSNTRTMMFEIIKSKQKLYAEVPCNFSDLLCDKNVVMRSQTLENSNGCAMKRQETQALLSNDDKFPGNIGGILASVTATQSFLPQAMKTEVEYTCQASVGNVRNTFGPCGTQGGASSAMICYSNNPAKESNLEENSQVVDGMKQVIPFWEPGNSSSVALNKRSKRSKKKEKERNDYKKARCDELRLPAPVASTDTENPQLPSLVASTNTENPQQNALEESLCSLGSV